MKHVLLLLAMYTTIVLVSCDDAKKSADVNSIQDTSKPIENKIMVPTADCYFYDSGKDTVKLKVELFPNVVTGKLLYKLYQKDSNNGEIDGKMNGDTLLADYNFMSEGIRSTRQVIFLIKDGIATEGYGDMEEKEGKLVFKNTSAITFGKGLTLKKADCGEY